MRFFSRHPRWLILLGYDIGLTAIKKEAWLILTKWLKLTFTLIWLLVVFLIYVCFSVGFTRKRNHPFGKRFEWQLMTGFALCLCCGFLLLAARGATYTKENYCLTCTGEMISIYYHHWLIFKCFKVPFFVCWHIFILTILVTHDVCFAFGFSK